MMTRIAIFLLCCAALTVGCEKKSQLPAAPPRVSLNTNQRTFDVRGVVVELETNGHTVRVKHDEIPGYMKPMTMGFDVKDTNELNGLSVGDVVNFRMIVTENDGWIDQIKKLDVPRTNNPPTTGPFRLVRDVEPLEEGDVLPEYHFVNQAGEKISTKQFQGGPVAITFLFTRCPFPTYCPLMANNFADAQKKLLAMNNAPTNWHLLTISFDPEFDTPAVLKSYAQRYNYDPARWTFATGELMDITAISEQFGLQFWREDGGSISHNLRTAVIDPSGKVAKVFIGNEWKSDELVEAMVQAAATKR